MIDPALREIALDFAAWVQDFAKNDGIVSVEDLDLLTRMHATLTQMLEANRRLAVMNQRESES